MKRKSAIKDLFDCKDDRRAVADLVKQVNNKLPKIGMFHGLPYDGVTLKVAQFWEAFKLGHWVPEKYRKQFALKQVQLRKENRNIQDVIDGKITLENAEEQRRVHRQGKPDPGPLHIQDKLKP